MSPFTAISVADTPTASLNPLVSRPTDVSVNLEYPHWLSRHLKRGPRHDPPTLGERDDSADASPPDPNTYPGQDRADKEAAGYLLAKQVSTYAETCADQAESVETALIGAYDADTYERYAEAVLAAESMAATS
jgi:hypothetical protein